MSELTEYTEAYLAYHGVTNETIQYVDRVIERFEWMVDLALRRATEQLAVPDLPDNVLLFRPRRTNPETNVRA